MFEKTTLKPTVEEFTVGDTFAELEGRLNLIGNIPIQILKEYY